MDIEDILYIGDKLDDICVVHGLAALVILSEYLKQ
jgi:hypothetical protein